MDKNELLMNDDACIVVYNSIFEPVQEVNTRQRHMHSMKERINPALQVITITTHSITGGTTHHQGVSTQTNYLMKH
jgi:hypothetical protein